VSYDGGVKRWAFTIILFLLLGAIVNVAVAWWCAWGISFPPRPTPTRYARSNWGPHTLTFIEYRTLGATRVRVHFWDGMDALQPLPGFGNESWLSSPNSLPQQSPPYWVEDLVSLRGRGLNGMPLDATGLPFRSMRCYWIDWVHHQDGIPLYTDAYMWRGTARQSALPLGIIAPGFVANTLLYAALWWSIFAAPFALRRWRRIKRGLCLKCGYDLHKRPSDSSVCPECGAATR